MWVFSEYKIPLEKKKKIMKHWQNKENVSDKIGLCVKIYALDIPKLIGAKFTMWRWMKAPYNG